MTLMGPVESGWQTFGDESFGIDVGWKSSVHPTMTADEATVGRVRLRVWGQTLWGEALPGGDDGVAWTWIDWLEQLARVWSRLQWEQRDPLGLNVELTELRGRARERWANEEDPQKREREQVRLGGFLEAHDLAAELGGIRLRSVFVLRQGNLARISWDDHAVEVPFSRVQAALEVFGDHVCARVSKLEDGRAKVARKAWRERDAQARDPLVFVRLSTGLEPGIIATIIGQRPPEHFFELSEARNDNELLAVARMGAGQLTGKDLSLVLKETRKLQPHARSSAVLDELSAAAAPALRGDLVAHAQGRELARWLRNRLEAGAAPIDPRATLAKWGVTVVEIELATPVVEAVSIWGPERGPTVFVNHQARRSSSEQGRRATLAHEMCHLLIDRTGALPLAEVLGGASPIGPEQRANGFAAEFLMPRDVAAAEFRKARTKTDAAGKLEGLRRRFMASREIIAWQTLRADGHLSDSVRSLLLSHLPEDKRYQVW